MTAVCQVLNINLTTKQDNGKFKPKREILKQSDDLWR